MAAKHILVVDDDPLVLASLRRLLGREGHAVALADGPPEALEMLSRTRYDLIISDHEMGSHTSTSFIAALPINPPPVIIYTGTPGVTNSNAVAVIAKGEGFFPLLEAVRKLE